MLAGAEGSVALADTEVVPAVVAVEMLPGRSSSEAAAPAVRAATGGAGMEAGRADCGDGGA